MGDWVSSQAMNETSRDLRENYGAIQNTVYPLVSIFMGMVSTYFLFQRNWIALLVSLIILELISLPRLIYLKKRRNELIDVQNRVRKICKARGINVPEGYKTQVREPN